MHDVAVLEPPPIVEPSASGAVRRFIADTFFVEGFAADASFLRDGILDSMGMLELVTFLEDRFDFRIAENELVPANLDSLDRVVAFVERKRAPARS